MGKAILRTWFVVHPVVLLTKNNPFLKLGSVVVLSRSSNNNNKRKNKERRGTAQTMFKFLWMVPVAASVNALDQTEFRE
jgi:hypothetical protein